MELCHLQFVYNNMCDYFCWLIEFVFFHFQSQGLCGNDYDHDDNQRSLRAHTDIGDDDVAHIGIKNGHIGKNFVCRAMRAKSILHYVHQYYDDASTSRRSDRNIGLLLADKLRYNASWLGFYFIYVYGFGTEDSTATGNGAN